MASLAEANTSFAFDLFKKISGNNKTGNVFYSPISISSALAMVYLGAKGSTATQMSKVLQLHKYTDDVHAGFCKLMDELRQKEEFCSLSLANRLYGEQSVQFTEKFLKDTQTFHKAELETVDFKTNAEAVRRNINQWVEKNTQDKIKDLLKEGAVNQSTKLVLVNAIYFKATWEKKFVWTETTEVPFKVNKNISKPVQMMRQEACFLWGRLPLEGCQVLELPYQGKELSMLILLPECIAEEGTGLELLEQKLTYENFAVWTGPMMEAHWVNVGLPRFRVEETYDLGEHLGNLGMPHAFEQDQCDFSGMSPSGDLVLSRVVHKSFVDVEEEGTEAAAATAAAMHLQSCFLTPPPKTFVADHPFLFLIRHKPTESIIFCGRYSAP